MGGFTSLLAFWLGGASSTAAVPALEEVFHNRVHLVPWQDRTHVVAYDDRVHLVAWQDPTHVVPFEDRVVLVPRKVRSDDAPDV